MVVDGYEFVADSITKFFNTIYVGGWFHHPNDRLTAVEFTTLDLTASVSQIGFDHGGVLGSLGPKKGFSIQILSPQVVIDESTKLRFHTATGQSIEASLHKLAADRISRYPTPLLAKEFHLEVDAERGRRVLDVGGRDRSKYDRSALFTNAECTVFDVLPGSNVDVVGDAHELSKHFPAEYFDAVISESVFEHLLMPWQVVCEINKVLKTGGIGLVSTHQTLGLHDAPWDFWRFSSDAWEALFNQHTGFEILASAMDFEQYVLPFVYRPNKEHAEKSAGYEGSSVMFRKVGPTKMEWPLVVKDIIDTTYPDNDDGQDPEARMLFPA